MPMLYAWAVPSPFDESPVDHTWVTTYDNAAQNLPDIASVIAAGEHYWYCWGIFHPRPDHPRDAGRRLLSAGADLTVAQCLVTPDTLDGKGTIFKYGLDGVCHQLANQVLYAASSRRKPKVTGARGYWASHFVYGDYGVAHKHWAAKVAQCTAAGGKAPPGHPLLGALDMPQPDGEGGDDFADHARAVLGDDRDRLASLLALRQASQVSTAYDVQNLDLVAPSAEQLNQRNQTLLDQAAALLDPAQYEAIFGFPPGTPVNLVDPDILAQDR